MPYRSSFITGHTIPLPSVDAGQTAPLRNGNGSLLDYHHHSVLMNRSRRFAFYSASNIDGRSWDPIERTGDFLKDERMDPSFQLGDELYASITAGRGRGRKNDFDEGHLTSFQEVLWGNENDMQKAGNDTFFFTNCMPQHSLLNRGAWKSLEQYITKKGADKQDIRVSVLTGPVFTARDPYFIQTVEDQYIRIPCAFWKIIYYTSPTGLSAVGFMMSHRDLLLEEGTVTYDKDEVIQKGLLEEEEDIFQQFPKATTYQVKVEFIQKVTGLPFFLNGVALPYESADNKEIIYKRIEVARTKSLFPVAFIDEVLDYKLEGITI